MQQAVMYLDESRMLGGVTLNDLLSSEDLSLSEQMSPSGIFQVPPSPFDVVAEHEMSGLLESAVSTLAPREQLIIKLRFGFDGSEGHTLEDISKRLGVSRERVRQIEAKALRKLRHPARSDRLKRALSPYISPSEAKAAKKKEKKVMALSRRAMDSLIPLLLRRRQLDETLPSGESVNDAVLRAVPLLHNAGGENDAPEPLTRRRAVGMPIPVETGGLIVNDIPPLMRSPIARVGSLSTVDALPALERPPTLVEGSHMLSPSEVASTGRLRLTQPVDPLIRAAENSAYADSSRPDFGQDKFGNPRTQAKRGFWGRFGAFGKALGQGMLEGRGLIPSLAGGAHAAADPDILAEGRLKRVQAENQQELVNQVGLRRAMTGIQSDQILDDWRKAQTRKILSPPQPKPIYRTNAQGQIVKITPGAEGEADRTEVVVSAKRTGAPNTQWADGKLLIFNPESRQYEPAADNQGREITDTLRTPVEFEIAGQRFKVSPNTAAMATATGERAKVEQINEQTKYASEWERREAERVAKEEQQFKEDSDFNEDLKRRIREKQREAEGEDANAKNPNIDPYYREEHRKRAIRLRDEIGEMQGQIRTPKQPSPARPAPQQTQYTPPRAAQSSGAVQRYSPQEQEYYNRMIQVGASPEEAAAGVRLKFKK
ncbi:MAG TPA: sigma-70 family RNA polymerase sigma factor [Pyrinomonadaceae bacterium]|nr:sigma-70 family RNA polymerase sigma factor [Pyrinomonadaceae bacterium]